MGSIKFDFRWLGETFTPSLENIEATQAQQRAMRIFQTQKLAESKIKGDDLVVRIDLEKLDIKTTIELFPEPSLVPLIKAYNEYSAFSSRLSVLITEAQMLQTNEYRSVSTIQRKLKSEIERFIESEYLEPLQLLSDALMELDSANEVDHLDVLKNSDSAKRKNDLLRKAVERLRYATSFLMTEVEGIRGYRDIS